MENNEKRIYFSQILHSRLNVLIELFEQCPADQRRVIPQGFNNHIHWHVGHVLTVTEFHVFALSEQPQVLPEKLRGVIRVRHEARGLAR